MEYRNDFHKEISEVWKIYTTAQESFLFAKYFSEKQKSNDHSPFKSPVFKYINSVMFKDSVIELFKIYNPNIKKEKTSLEKIKDKIRRNDYSSEIDAAVLKFMETQIKSNKQIIEKIELNRSKRFAHYESEIEVTPLLLGEIESILESTRKIISTIYSLCFDGQTGFRPLYFDHRYLEKIDNLANNEREHRINSILKR